MVRAPTLLLVAHGTQEAAGTRVIERIAGAAQRRTGAAVRVACVDVTGPTVAEALSTIRGPVVAVPAFLAAGYHVRQDLPAQIRDSPHGDEVVIADPLGPSPALALVMGRRLRAAGWQHGHRVVFAAAGSSDPRALADVDEAAGLLGGILRPAGNPLSPSYVTTAHPRTSEVWARPSTGDRPALIAPYLLAPGRFHRWLDELATGSVAAPIGAHPLVVELLVRRYRQACRVHACAA